MLQPVLGKMVSRPAVLDAQLAHDLADCAETSDGFQVYMGTTMCTLDFYEGMTRSTKVVYQFDYLLYKYIKLNTDATLFFQLISITKQKVEIL